MAKKKVKRIALIILNVLIIIGLGFTSGFYFVKYKNLKQATLSGDQKLAIYEKDIGKSYTLPTNEKGQLYAVGNADQLKKDETNKDFFKDIQNDDALIIYAENKLGIIYRPSTKKIIKTGPLAFTQQSTAFIVGAKAERETVIALLKEVFSKDLTKATEADPKIPLVAGVTIIVDVTGKNGDLVKRLATELKGVVGNVPEGQERAPEGAGVAIYAAPQAPGI